MFFRVIFLTKGELAFSFFEFCKERRQFLIESLNDSSYLDAESFVTANEAFFSRYKGKYLVVIEGRPIIDSQEVLQIDPLLYEKSMFIGWKDARHMFGEMASDGAVWLESRKKAIEYAKSLPPGWERDRYWHLYGL